jgi:hypothetical protein
MCACISASLPCLQAQTGITESCLHCHSCDSRSPRLQHTRCKPSRRLKHLHNVEMQFYCPKTFLEIDNFGIGKSYQLAVSRSLLAWTIIHSHHQISSPKSLLANSSIGPLPAVLCACTNFRGRYKAQAKHGQKPYRVPSSAHTKVAMHKAKVAMHKAKVALHKAKVAMHKAKAYRL